MIPSILLVMLISNPLPPVDKAAHFGVSYAMTHTCQVIIKKTTDLSRTSSTIICAAATLASGAARELTGNKDKNDMLANVAGVGLAVTIISIDW